MSDSASAWSTGEHLLASMFETQQETNILLLRAFFKTDKARPPEVVRLPRPGAVRVDEAPAEPLTRESLHKALMGEELPT